MRRAVFLDKDGTLVQDDPPNTDTARVRFYPEVFPALRLVREAGYAVIIATNQSAIAHGQCTESDVQHMQGYIRQRLADEGIELAGYYYCPHDAAGTVTSYAVSCRCRKPLPGLLLQASGELGVDMAQSWMVGDILHDVEAGRRAGCVTVLVDNGHETEWRLTPTRCPDHIVLNLLEAAHLIALFPVRARSQLRAKSQEAGR